jgi:hypothetical protein
LTRLLPLLLFVVACAPEPEVCEEMCALATDLQEACLDEDDLSWSDLGYQDAEDHVAWCETWVWEQQLLDRDAGERGRVETVCGERAESFRSATCEDYRDVGW